MTEQTERRIQEERRKLDLGCACARETNTVQGGCGKALTPIEFRRLADRRSTPKVAQTEDCKQCGFQPDMCLCPSIPDHLKELLKSASNCVSQSDPNCTPLPMGVPKMEQEIVQKIASNCGSSSTPSTPELPVGFQPAQPRTELDKAVLRWVEAKRQQILRHDSFGELEAEVRRQERDVEDEIESQLEASRKQVTR